VLWQSQAPVPNPRITSVAVTAAVLGVLLLALGLVARGDGAVAPMRIPVVSYHGVTTDETAAHAAADPRFFDVRLSELREQMEYLHDAGYRSITAEQYKRWVRGEPVTLPEKPILITFDDGRRSTQLATPILKELGFRATMYVVSGFADGSYGGPRGESGWYLNWDQLKAMRSSGVWEMQFHAGPRGHAYVTDPAHPDCHYFYPCRFGESDEAYRARVKSDVARGLGAMRSIFDLPADWRGATFALPWAGSAEPGQRHSWLSAYFANQFPVVFVDDDYAGKVDNQRYRFGVRNPYDLARFKSGLDSSLFAR
jgi:rhodanese-related sulfurtransferase